MFGASALVAVMVMAPAVAPELPIPPNSAERAALDQLCRRYDSGDAQKVAAMFTADADMTTLSGGLLQGREQIEEFYAAAFAGPYRGSRMSLDIDKIRVLGDDLAIVDGRWMITGDKLPRGHAEEGVFTFLITTGGAGGSITAARMSIPRQGHTRGVGRGD